MGRTPSRARDPLSHRDVGALQLLRHARLPHPLHDRTGGRRRSGLGGRRCGVNLRHLHGQRLGRRDCWRPRCRSLSRRLSKRAGGRDHHRPRTRRAGVQGPHLLLSRAGADRRWNGTPEAQHQHDRRRALPGRRQSPGRRVFRLLHGHQPRRLSGAAHRGIPRAARRLASWLWMRRCRHDVRRRAIRDGQAPPGTRHRAPVDQARTDHADRGSGDGSVGDSPQSGHASAPSSSSSSSPRSSGARTSRPPRR